MSAGEAPLSRRQRMGKIRAQIVAAADAQTPAWAHVVVAAALAAQGAELTAHAYDAEGTPTPLALAVGDLGAHLEALRDTMAAEEHAPRWRSAVIRVERETGAINFEFDYGQPAGWREWPAD